MVAIRKKRRPAMRRILCRIHDRRWLHRPAAGAHLPQRRLKIRFEQQDVFAAPRSPARARRVRDRDHRPARDADLVQLGVSEKRQPSGCPATRTGTPHRPSPQVAAALSTKASARTVLSAQYRFAPQTRWIRRSVRSPPAPQYLPSRQVSTCPAWGSPLGSTLSSPRHRRDASTPTPKPATAATPATPALPPSPSIFCRWPIASLRVAW